MRLFLLICTFSAFIIPSLAQSKWLVNVEDALQQASKSKKSVYIHFTGSDWCVPCQKLSKEVLSSKEFQNLARKELILTSLDFPKGSSLSQEQLAYNKSIAKKYSISAHPTSLLLDHQGNVYWKKIGPAPKQEFISELKQALRSKNTIVHNLYNATQTDGLVKAKHLLDAYNAMSSEMKNDHACILEEIIKLDTNDSLRVKERALKNSKDDQQEAILRQFLDKEVFPLIKKNEHEQALNKLKEYTTSSSLSTINRQRSYQIMARLNLDMHRKDQAIRLLKEVIKLSSDSPETQKAKTSLKNLSD